MKLKSRVISKNGQFTEMITYQGDGYIKYADIELNRYRNITDEHFGNYVFIRDIEKNEVYSITESPLFKGTHTYNFNEGVNFTLKTSKYIAKMDIDLSFKDNIEIRKIEIENISQGTINLEIITKTEPILTQRENDCTHRTFNGLFISEVKKEKDYVYAKRTLRGDDKNAQYMMQKIITRDKKNFTYENNLKTFIGDDKDKIAGLYYDKLRNSENFPVDAVLAIKSDNILIENGNKYTFYIINGYGTAIEQLDYYNDKYQYEYVEDIFGKSKSNERNILKKFVDYVCNYQNIPLNETKNSYLYESKYTQKDLWSYGISGDNLIVTFLIYDTTDERTLNIISDLYIESKQKNLGIDFIIINLDKEKYNQIIEENFNNKIMNRLKNVSNKGIYRCIYGNELSKEYINFLKGISLIYFDLKRQLLQIITESMVENNDEIEEILDSNILNLVELQEKQYQTIIKENYEDYADDFYNGYGMFENNGKEYKIVNQDTPTIWSLVIANNNFGSIVTNKGSSFTYAKSSQEFKLTTWINNISYFIPSENIVINGEYFKTADTTFGFGYAKYHSKTTELEQTLLQYISIENNSKIYKLTLKNLIGYDIEKNVGLEIKNCLGKFEERSANKISYKKCDKYMILKNTFDINYKDECVYLTKFGGKDATFDCSNVLKKGIYCNIKIPKNQERTIYFVLGVEKNETLIEETISKLSVNLDKEYDKVKEYWQDKLTKIQVDTGEKSFDYMLNGWYLYQTICSRIMAKAGYYQVSGAMGFRDQLQDSTNICFVFPEQTKTQIIENASHQFYPQGDVLHWWTSNNFGLRSRYKDDGLWLIYATYKYIKIECDTSILNQNIPFIEGDELTKYQEDNCIQYRQSDNKKTLYDHLKIIIENSINDLGVHGLSKMGGGDWNDGMNKVGIDGKGESVWLTFFLYDMISKFIYISKVNSNMVDIERYQKIQDKLKENLLKNGYDERYFLRAYFDNGEKLGSVSNDECKIDLISQAFSIITGIADNSQTESILSSINYMLYDRKYKLVKLLFPAFKNTYAGYISNYPKGIRENGGQYTHSVAWYILALIKSKNYEWAYYIYQMINPINRTLTKDDCNRYKVEPYVIVADIYSSRGNEGRGGWTWYTGSSGWFYNIGIQNILGLKKRGNILYIDPMPNLPFKKYKVRYKYKKTIYNITINVDKNKSTYSLYLEDNKGICDLEITI